MDPDNLREILKLKRRQKVDTMHIEDAQMLVMKLKFLLFWENTALN